jgi:hypothetical protein
MSEDNEIVGGSDYAGLTTVHPLGLGILIAMGLCVLFLPKKWSLFPVLVMTCFVSSAQRIVIMGMDFDFLRIMVLFGVARLILRNEYSVFIWKSLDFAVVAWVVSAVFFNVIQQGTTAVIINRLGFAFDSFGMYFVFRCLINDWEDLNCIILGIFIVSIPIALLFLFEEYTTHNLFAIFGGVAPITVIREGRLRCQGAFSHPILAGCFWAACIPVLAANWWKSEKSRIYSIIGIVASLIIIMCCASSTPVMGTISALIGGILFFLRRQMHIVRWSILLLLVSLHMIMKAPVWHLISRISAVGGSTSWHRYNLIDQTIKHFGDWWLYGCSGYTVLSWGIWAGDVTNQYILEGIRGGFLTMCLFITIIVIAFREIGRLWRYQERNPYRVVLVWTLGVSLFVHCSNFIGIAYFGQIWVIWYLLLAIIGSLSLSPNQLTVSKNMRRNINREIKSKLSSRSAFGNV